MIVSTAMISDTITRVRNNHQSGHWKSHHPSFLEMRQDLQWIIAATKDHDNFYLSDDEMENLTEILNDFTAFILGIKHDNTF